MKIRSAVLLLAVLLPAYFAATPRSVHIPPDLRDAVGGGEALNGLPDYALVQLDRKVTGRKPLAVNKGKGVSAGDPLFVGEAVTKIAALGKYIP